jgi:hypothetical protein
MLEWFINNSGFTATAAVRMSRQLKQRRGAT